MSSPKCFQNDSMSSFSAAGGERDQNRGRRAPSGASFRGTDAFGWTGSDDTSNPLSGVRNAYMLRGV